MKGLTAAILREAGRHVEAESRYKEVLKTAEQIGDFELQGTTLQHLGTLQQDTGRISESIDTLHQALRIFRHSGDQASEMLTCNLLGSAELKLGRVDPAESWYRKSLELAHAPNEELIDRHQIGIVRQNLGILYQTRAELITKSLPDSLGWSEVAAALRDRLLASAVREIGMSLEIWQETGDPLGAAASHFQLGVLHRLRGHLERAEFEVRQSLTIIELLSHPNIWMAYIELADIARARGDEREAAKWEAKAKTKRDELERLAAGPDDGASGGGPDRAVMETLTALTQSVYHSRTQHRPPPPDIAERLAQLANFPPPLGPFGAFLQAIARFDDPPPPPGLPEPLAELAARLVDALALGP